MGRHKNTGYLSYNDARYIVQIEQIQSRAQYWTWWDMWRPRDLPRHPDAVYAQWTGWNDFVGNTNAFKNRIRKRYRTFAEALAYAKTSRISTSTQWMATKHPPDIPVRPDIVYRGEFKGWKHFLQTGVKRAARVVDVSKQIEIKEILAFLHPAGNPVNIFYVSVFLGVGTMKEFCVRNQMSVVRVFKNEPGYDWQAVLRTHGTDYGNNEWIIQNPAELFYNFGLMPMSV